ncbi:Appr-1-p processing protein [Micromonospora echinaurantiaca]|uniref:Appr-1-p processing protein n=1 Tax=Micromonospora echinaurantiaca TaxID=47857 RepID=UPI003715771E
MLRQPDSDFTADAAGAAALVRQGSTCRHTISRRWPEPERDYRQWHRGLASNDFALGVARLVQVAPDVWVANMVGQRGIRTGSAGPPIRYDAVERCLTSLAEPARALGASVHMPRIGCGLAGGTWNRVEPIVLRTLCARDISVTAYDHR